MIELDDFGEKSNLHNSFNSSKVYYNLFPNDTNLSYIDESKSKFFELYHFLCKYCKDIPVIKFIKKNKIKYSCKCKESSREFLIKDVYDYLYFKEKIEIEIRELNCEIHEEKNIFYCEQCEKNLCNRCVQK